MPVTPWPWYCMAVALVRMLWHAVAPSGPGRWAGYAAVKTWVEGDAAVGAEGAEGADFNGWIGSRGTGRD